MQVEYHPSEKLYKLFIFLRLTHFGSFTLSTHYDEGRITAASERASEQLSRFRELNEKATKGENFIKSNYYYINVLEKEKIKEAKISALLKFLFTVVNVTH